MPRTHCFDIERLKYCGIRILLGLIKSTPNNSLGMLPPLEHRMLYLNYRYLVKTFQKAGYPLRSRLELLHGLNPRKLLNAFREAADLGTCYETGYTRHSFEAMVASLVVGRHMEEVLANVNPEMYSMPLEPCAKVAPREFLVGYSTLMVLLWMVWVALPYIIHWTVVMVSVWRVHPVYSVILNLHQFLLLLSTFPLKYLEKRFLFTLI
jgi:hypothetical protein